MMVDARLPLLSRCELGRAVQPDWLQSRDLQTRHSLPLFSPQPPLLSTIIPSSSRLCRNLTTRPPTTTYHDQLHSLRHATPTFPLLPDIRPTLYSHDLHNQNAIPRLDSGPTLRSGHDPVRLSASQQDGRMAPLDREARAIPLASPPPPKACASMNAGGAAMAARRYSVLPSGDQISFLCISSVSYARRHSPSMRHRTLRWPRPLSIWTAIPIELMRSPMERRRPRAVMVQTRPTRSFARRQRRPKDVKSDLVASQEPPVPGRGTRAPTCSRTRAGSCSAGKGAEWHVAPRRTSRVEDLTRQDDACPPSTRVHFAFTLSPARRKTIRMVKHPSGDGNCRDPPRLAGGNSGRAEGQIDAARVEIEQLEVDARGPHDRRARPPVDDIECMDHRNRSPLYQTAEKDGGSPSSRHLFLLLGGRVSRQRESNVDAVPRLPLGCSRAVPP